MELINKDFETAIERYPLYSQENVKDPIVSIKLFIWNATWYITEYDKDSKTAFWLTTWLWEDEFGYTYIPELEEVKVNWIFEVERDLYFKPAPLSSLLSWETREKIQRLLWMH